MLTTQQKNLARTAPQVLRGIPSRVNDLLRQLSVEMRNSPIGQFYIHKVKRWGETRTYDLVRLSDRYQDFKLSLAHPRTQADIRRHEILVIDAIDTVHLHDQTEAHQMRRRSDYDYTVKIFRAGLSVWDPNAHYDDRVRDTLDQMEHLGLTSGEWFDTYMVAKAVDRRWDALRELSAEATPLIHESTGVMLTSMEQTMSSWAMSFLYGHLCDYLAWAARELTDGADRHIAECHRLQTLLVEHTASVHRAHKAQEKRARGR